MVNHTVSCDRDRAGIYDCGKAHCIYRQIDLFLSVFIRGEIVFLASAFANPPGKEVSLDRRVTEAATIYLKRMFLRKATGRRYPQISFPACQRRIVSRSLPVNETSLNIRMKQQYPDETAISG
jgi:hypothetical protein